MSENRNDNDWYEYKKLILAELEKHGDDIEKTRTIVNDMRVTLTVLQSKLMTISAISSTVVGAIVSFIMGKLLK